VYYILNDQAPGVSPGSCGTYFPDTSSVVGVLAPSTPLRPYPIDVQHLVVVVMLVVVVHLQASGLSLPSRASTCCFNAPLTMTSYGPMPNPMPAAAPPGKISAVGILTSSRADFICACACWSRCRKLVAVAPLLNRSVDGAVSTTSSLRPN
jgi:hypothetical protein